MESQKGEGRGNAKVLGDMIFSFSIFSLLAMMVTNIVFRNSSLENFVLKNGPWYF